MYSNHRRMGGRGTEMRLSELKAEYTSEWNASDDRHQMILNLEINNPTNYIDRSPFMEKLQSRMELYFDRTD